MTRRWQSPRATRRRLSNAYGAMGRRADRVERGCGCYNMLSGRAYDRYSAAWSHDVICRQFDGPDAYRLYVLAEDGAGEAEVLQAAE